MRIFIYYFYFHLDFIKHPFKLLESRAPQPAAQHPPPDSGCAQSYLRWGPGRVAKSGLRPLGQPACKKSVNRKVQLRQHRSGQRLQPGQVVQVKPLQHDALQPGLGQGGQLIAHCAARPHHHATRAQLRSILPAGGQFFI